MSNDLIKACRMGDLNTVKLLHQQGYNFKDRDVLDTAIVYERVDIVKYLIDNELIGYKSNFDDEFFTVIKYNYFDIFNILIETCKPLIKYGFINILDTPLIWASQEGRLKMVKYLVKNGADIYENQDAPLKEAIKHNHTSVINFLKSKYSQHKLTHFNKITL